MENHTHRIILLFGLAITLVLLLARTAFGQITSPLPSPEYSPLPTATPTLEGCYDWYGCLWRPVSPVSPLPTATTYAAPYTATPVIEEPTLPDPTATATAAAATPTYEAVPEVDNADPVVEPERRSKDKEDRGKSGSHRKDSGKKNGKK